MSTDDNEKSFIKFLVDIYEFGEEQGFCIGEMTEYLCHKADSLGEVSPLELVQNRGNDAYARASDCVKERMNQNLRELEIESDISI